MVAKCWPTFEPTSLDEQNELENEDEVDEDDDDDEQVDRPLVEFIRLCCSELTKSSAIEHS